MPAQENDQEKREVAKRYARWILAGMVRRGWDQARVVQESGLSKQEVSALVNGKRGQPTAHQIVALARAFGVDPTDVLAELGLWEERSHPLPTLDTYLRITMDLTDEQIEHVRRTLIALDAERRLAEREVAESEENITQNMPDESDPMLERRAAEGEVAEEQEPYSAEAKSGIESGQDDATTPNDVLPLDEE